MDVRVEPTVRLGTDENDVELLGFCTILAFIRLGIDCLNRKIELFNGFPVLCLNVFGCPPLRSVVEKVDKLVVPLKEHSSGHLGVWPGSLDADMGCSISDATKLSTEIFWHINLINGDVVFP